MNKPRLLRALAGLAAALWAVPAQATLVTSLPTGTVIAMPSSNYFGPGPQVFGPGITWSSTNASNQGGSVFGYTGSYGFFFNGSWTGSLGPMAGLNDSFDNYGTTDTMTFAFSSPVSGVGGFLNYLRPSESENNSTPTIIAIRDAGMNLLDSFSLDFNTGGGNDTGFFYGFLLDSPNISYFQLTDNYIGITDLTIVSEDAAPVPEPGTLALLGAGLAGLAARRRRT